MGSAVIGIVKRSASCCRTESDAFRTSDLAHDLAPPANHEQRRDVLLRVDLVPRGVVEELDLWILRVCGCLRE